MAPERKVIEEPDAKKAPASEKPEPGIDFVVAVRPPSRWERRGNAVLAGFWLGAAYAVGVYVVFDLLDKLVERARRDAT